MPEQGEIKWTTQFVADKETVIDILEEAYIDIDQLGSYTAEVVVAVAPYLLNGIASTLASLGGTAISMILSSFKNKCKNQIVDCIEAVVEVEGNREIAIMAKYKWTEKEGGNWMPQYEIRHLVVESA